MTTPPRRSGNRRRLLSEQLESRRVMAATPIITEFLASNSGGLEDADGDSSDWIEIHNPTSQSFSLDGWSLTDDAGELDRWTFPAVDLAAGESMVVFASDKDRAVAGEQLHTNFKLSAGGEYLALVQPNQTIVSQFSPEYPEQSSNLSYGFEFQADVLVDSGANASTLIPASGSLGSVWQQPSFNDTSWTTGATGIGFGVVNPGFEVLYVKAQSSAGFDGNIDDVNEAETVLATLAYQSTSVVEQADVINFYNTGGNGNFNDDLTFPSLTIGEDINHFAIEATSSVEIPSAGTWTFGVNSDDGFRLTLSRNGDTFLSEWVGTRGSTDTLETFSLPDAGTYDLRLVFFDRTGGGSVELFAAQGSKSTFDSSFDLVGDVASGGLAAQTTSSALQASLVQTDVGSAMLNVNASAYVRVPFQVADAASLDSLFLEMQYDDGFVAYINGVEAIRQNAPSSLAYNSSATIDRGPEETQQIQVFAVSDLAANAIVTGQNVLAIHGLNSSASDDSFLVLPRLVSQSVLDSAPTYFATPTPGQANVDPVLGVVERVSVSVPAGFYETSQSITLSTTTAGAVIRYTTDGSEPTTTNGVEYSGPISISSTTNLRTIATKPDFVTLPSVSRTYLFLDDIVTQSSNGEIPPNWPSDWSGHSQDLGMDPDVIALEGATRVKEALTSIPTISLTTDLDNLFDPQDGIYVNPQQDGRDWERPASAEWINPDGSEGFQVNAGLRIRGGASRNPNNPKHSFKLFFRGSYGDSTLDYPVHGDAGVSEFSKLDLRSPQNYSWSKDGNASNNFIAESLARTTQLELGEPSTRSQWVHLYLNGQYWGMYQTQERADANFGESYFGGDAEDFDVLKPEGDSGYIIEATDGNFDAYDELWQQAAARADDGVTPAFISDADYLKAQGKNPDGTENLAYPVLLDVDNLSYYMLDVLRSGNRDAGISGFLGNNRPNNFFAMRDRTSRDGFKFFQHDAEHTWRFNTLDQNGPFNHPNFDTDSTYFNPQWLHQQLMANEEYRLQFADKIQETFFNGGVLSVEATQARVDQAVAEIEDAVIANSARWGDAQREESETPYTQADFYSAIDDLRNNRIPNRIPLALEQFKNTTLGLKNSPSSNDYTDVVPAPLFPDVDAPEFFVNGQMQFGGEVSTGTQVDLVASDGTVYYTTDGTDPRDFGGSANSAASSFQIGEVTTRVIQEGDNWRYFDQGGDLGTAWRASGYDDSTWGNGDGEFGYGDGDENTELEFGGVETNKHTTTYFRKDIVVPAGSITTATLRILRDDGAAVYLNGVEVTEARSNLGDLAEFPAGGIPYDRFATNTVGGGNESSFTTISIPASRLVPGNNTIAVEIHQSSLTSSDISFDMSLDLTVVSSDQNSSIPVDVSTQVKARVLSADGTWSALSDAVFEVPGVPADATNLRLTEIYYDPAGDGVEFVEVQNVSDSPIVLDGVVLTDGPSTDFVVPAGNTLQAGEFAVIVGDQVDFLAANPSVAADQVLGEWASGKLSNSGEKIRLEDASGIEIADLSYTAGDLWSIAANGSGASLELLDPANTDADLVSKPYVWRASTIGGGTPGTSRIEPSGIVINEVLAHTDTPQVDSVELFNPTSSAIDISGWYLSDDVGEPLKHQIEAGTTIAAGGFVVLNESDFGGVEENDFLLSASAGEQVILTQSTDGTLASHIEDAVEFGATFNGQSLGRIPGDVSRLAPLVTPSLGVLNGGFAWSEVTISEVNYHPTDPGVVDVSDNDMEFIELYNPSDQPVSLTNWRLAVTSDTLDDLVFTSESIPAKGTLVVVSFDPVAPSNALLLSTFRSHYSIDANVSLVGPLGGSLSNSHGIVKLMRPDDPPFGEEFFPSVLTDEVFYDDQLPWATDADGGGQSLNRIASTTLGNFTDSWTGSVPSPGQFTESGNVSSIVINNDRTTRSEITSITVTFDGPVDATVDDFQLINLTSNENVSGLDLQVSGQVATLTFTGGASVAGELTDPLMPTLENGNYELKFERDGDFSSVAAETIDSFFRKFGDSSGDDAVGLTDFASFRATFGLESDNLAFDSSLDSNRDGIVGLTDFAVFRAGFGT